MLMRWHWPPENSRGRRRAVDEGVDADLVEHGVGRVASLLLGADLPDGQRLGHDVDDPAARVERRDRVLEDHLHLRAQRAQVAAAERGQLGVAEDDLARGGLLDLDDGPSRRGLAAARLADEAERLPLAHREADAGHGLHRSRCPGRRRRGGPRRTGAGRWPTADGSTAVSVTPAPHRAAAGDRRRRPPSGGTSRRSCAPARPPPAGASPRGTCPARRGSGGRRGSRPAG